MSTPPDVCWCGWTSIAPEIARSGDGPNPNSGYYRVRSWLKTVLTHDEMWDLVDIIGPGGPVLMDMWDGKGLQWRGRGYAKVTVQLHGHGDASSIARKIQAARGCQVTHAAQLAEDDRQRQRDLADQREDLAP